MEMAIDLDQQNLQRLLTIFKRYPELEQIKLYGSRAKGTATERSDIDLAAYGKRLDRFIIAQILFDLDDSDIPYAVDLQNYHDIQNQQLVNHIDRIGILIYSTEHSALSE